MSPPCKIIVIIVIGKYAVWYMEKVTFQRIFWAIFISGCSQIEITFSMLYLKLFWTSKFHDIWKQKTVLLYILTYNIINNFLIFNLFWKKKYWRKGIFLWFWKKLTELSNVDIITLHFILEASDYKKKILESRYLSW